MSRSGSEPTKTITPTPESGAFAAGRYSDHREPLPEDATA